MQCNAKLQSLFSKAEPSKHVLLRKYGEEHEVRFYSNIPGNKLTNIAVAYLNNR